jgi:hypothetical protein
MRAGRGSLAKLNYMDIKQNLDRKAIENKQGTLTTGEIQLLVREIHDRQGESNLERDGSNAKEDQVIQCCTAGGATTGTGRRNYEDSSVSNGRMRQCRNKRDKDCSNGITNKKTQRQPMLIHGAQL